MLALGGLLSQIAPMAHPAVDLEALRRLPVAERIRLVEELWDSIVDDTSMPDLPISPRLDAELQRRLTDWDNGRERTLPWSEVRERIARQTLSGP